MILSETLPEVPWWWLEKTTTFITTETFTISSVSGTFTAGETITQQLPRSPSGPSQGCSQPLRLLQEEVAEQLLLTPLRPAQGRIILFLGLSQHGTPL